MMIKNIMTAVILVTCIAFVAYGAIVGNAVLIEIFAPIMVAVIVGYIGVKMRNKKKSKLL